MSRVTILMYHQVGDFAPMATHRAGYCHYKSFGRQMAYLRWGGYRVIRLADALRGLAGEAPLPKRAVVLTFDDGYVNFQDYAFPVLQHHGYPSTVFLVSGLIGATTRWLASDGRGDTPLLNREQILSLRARGVAFGAHSVSHPRLSQLEPAAMETEIRRGKQELETLLGEAVPHFCYPYGDYDETVLETVARSGYTAALTCMRGDAQPGDDPFQLPRKAISYGDSLAGYFWKIEMKRRRKQFPFPHPGRRLGAAIR